MKNFLLFLLINVFWVHSTQGTPKTKDTKNLFLRGEKSCEQEIDISLPPEVQSGASSRNIPDPFKCKETGDPSCAGWRYVRTYDEILYGGKDPIFAWEGGNTLCLSIFRTDSGPNVLQVQCYNTTNCSVCAFSSGDTLQKQDHIHELRQPHQLGSSAGQDCSKCHATGPMLLSKDELFDLKDTTSRLSKICAANGGPKWAGSPAISWSQPDSKTIVASPESCVSCHDNFVKRNTGGFNKGFCEILKGATEHELGSMREHAFYSDEEKKTFLGEMGCL